MDKLERALRLCREPAPSFEQLERMINMLESNDFINDCLSGWSGKNQLPPENVLRALLERDFHGAKRVLKH